MTINFLLHKNKKSLKIAVNYYVDGCFSEDLIFRLRQQYKVATNQNFEVFFKLSGIVFHGGSCDGMMKFRVLQQFLQDMNFNDSLESTCEPSCFVAVCWHEDLLQFRLCLHCLDPFLLDVSVCGLPHEKVLDDVLHRLPGQEVASVQKELKQIGIGEFESCSSNLLPLHFLNGVCGSIA